MAISGTSSIGGFWFLQNTLGTTIWKSLGAVAIVIIAVAEERFKLGHYRMDMVIDVAATEA